MVNLSATFSLNTNLTLLTWKRSNSGNVDDFYISYVAMDINGSVTNETTGNTSLSLSLSRGMKFQLNVSSVFKRLRSSPTTAYVVTGD